MKVTQENGLGPWEKEGNRLLNVKINSYFQEVGTPAESAIHIMLLKVTVVTENKYCHIRRARLASKHTRANLCQSRSH